VNTARTVWNDPVESVRMDAEWAINHYGSQEYASVRATESASTELGRSRSLAGCHLGWNGFGFRGGLDFEIPRSITAIFESIERAPTKKTTRFTDQHVISPDAGIALILPA